MRFVSASSIVFVLLLALSSPAVSAVIQVPVDQPTIALGVAAAGAGDTVMVACGVYTENDIPLVLEITILSATGEPDCVTIDAGGLGRVFFQDILSESVHIEGITMTGGNPTLPGTGSWDTWGGGMLLLGDDSSVINCVFTGNNAEEGGGLARSGHGATTVTDCEFLENTSVEGGGALTVVGIMTLTDCVFAGNQADSTGGGVYSYLGTTNVIGCTFYGNGANKGSALFSEQFGLVNVDRSILSFGTGGGSVICETGSVTSITCSDVYSNAGGDWIGCIAGENGLAGNFSADPLFCNGAVYEFGLQGFSPCRPGNHPDGASCGLVGASDATCSILDVGGEPGAGLARLRMWPNPFRGALHLALDGVGEEDRRIAIFDVHGRRVRELHASGSVSELVWDGKDAQGRSLPAGAYYVRFRSGGEVRTGSVLLLH